MIATKGKHAYGKGKRIIVPSPIAVGRTHPQCIVAGRKVGICQWMTGISLYPILVEAVKLIQKRL